MAYSERIVVFRLKELLKLSGFFFIYCFFFFIFSPCLGPDKVGRKELRQKLILFSQERFAGVVPRKELVFCLYKIET